MPGWVRTRQVVAGRAYQSHRTLRQATPARRTALGDLVVDGRRTQDQASAEAFGGRQAADVVEDLRVLPPQVGSPLQAGA